MRANDVFRNWKAWAVVLLVLAIATVVFKPELVQRAIEVEQQK